jgi:hypothetical protein
VNAAALHGSRRVSQPGVRALACILCLAACDAGAKPEPPHTQPPAKQKLAIPPKQPANTSAFNLTYLPADSDVLVHVDVAKLRQSKLWPSYSHDAAKLLVAGFSNCDYDPMTEIASVDVGVPIASGLSVFVIRGIDRKKSLECFHRIEKEPDRSMFDGDFFTLTTLRGTRVMKFIDEHTLVVQGTNKPTKQTLEAVIESGTPLANNKEVASALVRSQSLAAVTVISRPGSEALAKQMDPAGVKFKFFYATLDLTDQLAVHYVMDLYSPDQATSLANMMKGQLDNQSVKQLFDQLETHAQENVVMVTARLGETKLANLAGMVRGMIPDP